MDLAIKKLLNSLHCPICYSQIDVITKSFYYCVQNTDHYQLFLSDGYIHSESVSVYDQLKKYRISQYHEIVPSTIIYMYDTDAEHRVINENINYKAEFLFHLFDFQMSNKHDILDRVKFSLIFS